MYGHAHMTARSDESTDDGSLSRCDSPGNYLQLICIGEANCMYLCHVCLFSYLSCRRPGVQGCGSSAFTPVVVAQHGGDSRWQAQHTAPMIHSAAPAASQQNVGSGRHLHTNVPGGYFLPPLPATRVHALHWHRAQ